MMITMIMVVVVVILIRPRRVYCFFIHPPFYQLLYIVCRSLNHCFIMMKLQMFGTYIPFWAATKDSIARLIILTLPRDYLVLNVDIVLNVIVIIIIFSLQIFSRKTVQKYTQAGIYFSLSWFWGQAETGTSAFL